MKTHWKTILATLGVILPAVFSYLSARADSSEAKIRAEIAYVTLQESVKELQDASYEHAIAIAELKGRLKAEKRMRAEMAAERPSYQSPSPVDGDTVADAEEPTARPKFKATPDFNEAVQTFKAKR